MFASGRKRLHLLLVALAGTAAVLCCLRRCHDDQQDKATKGVRILCYVLLSPTLHQRAFDLRMTWGSECDRLIFFTSRTDHRIPEHNLVVLRTNTNNRTGSLEGYGRLWSKSRAALVRMNRSGLADHYDWLLKADHDTFVHMGNLRAHLLRRDSRAPQYVGALLRDPGSGVNYVSGGAGYVLSKEVMRLLANNLEAPSAGPCRDTGQKEVSEDLQLGKCLASLGIMAEEGVDSHGLPQFLPLPPSTILPPGGFRPKWIWKRRPRRPVDIPLTGPGCCSPRFISFHRVDQPTMWTLHFLTQGQ